MLANDEFQHPPSNRLRLLRRSWKALARKIDPGSTRVSRRLRTLYWISSGVHSTMHHIQEQAIADQLQETEPPAPLFVLGFWRSGTTLLHELLACDVRFGFPSTYACLNPAHFILSERWIQSRGKPQVRRPMDDLRYSWESPQEDEFALLALGAPSAYEALIFPSLMRNADQLLNLQARPQVDQDLWYATFEYFLKLLTIQQGKAMILKSPTHGYRLPILQHRIPKARYVLIVRNPYEVFASNLKLWTTLIARYGLETYSKSALEEFVLNAYVLHEKIVSEATPRLTPGSIAEIRYEDLVSSPIEQMSRVYSTIGLGDFETVRPRMEAYLAKTSGHRRNRLQFSKTQRVQVERAWGNIIREKGYSWMDCSVALSEEAMAR